MQRLFGFAFDGEHDRLGDRHRLEHLRRQHRLEHIGRLERHERNVRGGEDVGNALARNQSGEEDVGRTPRFRESPKRPQLGAVTDKDEPQTRVRGLALLGDGKNRLKVVRHADRAHVAHDDIISANAKCASAPFTVSALPELGVYAVRDEVKLQRIDASARQVMRK